MKMPVCPRLNVVLCFCLECPFFQSRLLSFSSSLLFNSWFASIFFPELTCLNFLWLKLQFQVFICLYLPICVLQESHFLWLSHFLYQSLLLESVLCREKKILSFTLPFCRCYMGGKKGYSVITSRSTVFSSSPEVGAQQCLPRSPTFWQRFLLLE